MDWVERAASRRRTVRDSGDQAMRLVYRSLSTLAVGEELELEEVSIPVPRLHPALDGYRIVQLSDLHLFPFTTLDFIRKAVEKANAARPDLIVLTGDYVSSTASAMDDLQPVLAGLNARDGVYATLGNHDHWTNANVIRAGLRAAGLTVLHNQSIPLGGGKLWLSGLDDGWVGRADFEAALDEAPGDAPVVLLVHEPDLVDSYARNPRVVLQLSGHTHGGQVRLRHPRRAYTLPHLGRKYDQGLFRVRDTWLYTNRGVGMIVVPVRVNCPAEVSVFTLSRGPLPTRNRMVPHAGAL